MFVLLFQEINIDWQDGRDKTEAKERGGQGRRSGWATKVPKPKSSPFFPIRFHPKRPIYPPRLRKEPADISDRADEVG